MARSSSGQSSLSRAVLVLEAFDPGTQDLNVSQIAARAGMPLSTAHRLASELVALGLLERVEHRRYRVGLRLWELAVRTPGALGLREVALEPLRAAHARIGQSVQLCVLQGTEMLYLERFSAPHAAVNFVVVGGRVPYHATSSGLVLLAHLEPDRQQEILRVPLVDYGRAPRPSTPVRMNELAAIRRDGYAITRGYVDAAATSIAVPVIGPTGTAVAAVSAIVPAEDTREEQVLPVLLATSAAITMRLRDRYEAPSAG